MRRSAARLPIASACRRSSAMRDVPARREDASVCRSKSPDVTRGSSSFGRRSTSIKADRVAVAHTRDDQAETVMLRLTRGAGSSGLAAMAPRRDHVIRPLLDVTRTELQDVSPRAGTRRGARTRPISIATIPRNRVRHEVMPRAARDQRAGRCGAGARRGDSARRRRISRAACQRGVPPLRPSTMATGRRSRLDRRGEFSKLPVALARRVARYALETANPSRSYGLEEADELRRAVAAGTGANLPGLTVERFGANAVLVSRQVQPVHGCGPPLIPSNFDWIFRARSRRRVARGAVTAEGPMARRPQSIASRRGKVMVDARRDRLAADRADTGVPAIGCSRSVHRGARKCRTCSSIARSRATTATSLPIVTTVSGEIVWVAGAGFGGPVSGDPAHDERGSLDPEALGPTAIRIADPRAWRKC